MSAGRFDSSNDTAGTITAIIDGADISLKDDGRGNNAAASLVMANECINVYMSVMAETARGNKPDNSEVFSVINFTTIHSL